MFKVYDEVWIMEDNKLITNIVFAVIHSMDDAKTGIETHYQLVSDQCGAGWGNNSGVRKESDRMFKTKEELLSSL
jgi:hypothetical protein